ncbi:BtpA family membrane complex biogenesis protein [Bacillus sp. V3-13]|uniref:BtpA/SgcQ family protein n=1 Tax=Bacillus sp. V3-13 TaxID=2053728 RepID=UPI000C775485|nr:BtpA/SgcQ family protein [Bacillus sp. V3-13]PLR75739.1 BtpA family membrane complex biogenesis protein [Bacillus sp. V3-13]
MSNKIFPAKPNYIKEIFNQDRAVIGMVHLRPLPGAPHFKGGNLDEVYDWAIRDAAALEEGGVDGLIIENAWDIPFSKPEDIGFETVAAMTSVANRLKTHTDLPIGINCLANGAIQALAVAKAADLPFVRVNQWVNAYIANEGFVEGASAKAARYRSQIKGEDIRMFVDVHVKHGSHSIIADRNLADQTHDNIFFDADVLIATGTRTGNETELTEIEGIKNHTSLPVIVGSGMTVNNAAKILSLADGCIIGSSLKEEGEWWNPVSKEEVIKFMSEVKKVR